jgi:cation diffusion facilitator family transporter
LDAAKKNIQIQKWVAIISVALLLGKWLAFYITNSVSILTDALESIVNVVAGFLGLYSLYISAKPRDLDHPYGHGKIEFISAAIEGVMISMAAVLIIIEAIQQFIEPTPIQKLDVGILLITITAAINFILGSVCLRIGRKNNSPALLASGKHLHSDTYTTLGILVGLALIYLTEIPWLDGAVALAFSVFILYTGFRIIRSSIAGIMDERDKSLLEQMVKVVNENRSKNWMDLHNLRIIKYGSVLHIDCHLTVPWYLNVHEAHDEIDKLRTIVSKEFGGSIEFFVHSDGCLPISCPICVKEDCPVRQHGFVKRISWTVQNVQQNEKHQVTTV